MRKLRPDRITAPGSIEGKLTSADPADLMRRFHEDGLSLPESITMTGNLRSGPAAVMLEARMLFSTLVDADFLATERHFDCEKADLRRTSELNSQLAVEALDRYLLKLHQEKRGVESVVSMRIDLLTACREAAALPIGTFTLTAPTGSGKTLSMLAFALGHAKVHNLRRIVVVLPYLSIIEQTAHELRKALEELGSERLVLEHHSLAVTPAEEMNEDAVRTQAILAENWDAPIVVTTSVECLESLFANKSAPCRKLHRLANSVILFDEVQTLPLGVIVPTLASLSFLAQRYGSTVVFATATQPAFTRLAAAAQKFSFTGWSPREIVPASLNLFGRTRRVKIEWPSREERMRWDDLVEKLRSIPQALCIVNLRKHSRLCFRR